MCVTHSHPIRGRILLALFLSVASFTFLSSAVAFPDWTDCPAVCRCKWTSGKKSALCPDAGLTTLPPSLDPDMQVLDLSGNKIVSLYADMFSGAKLLNLQRVFLRSAEISKVDKDTFRELRILVEVDLSDNEIELLHPETFLGNERLRLLVLSGNKLSRLSGPQFPILPHLRTLELQRCALSEIHSMAFTGVTGLETLRLEANRLENVEALAFLPLTHLKTLSLDGNPWSCDCRLRKLRLWLTPNRLYSVPQRCEGPLRLAGRRWEEVKPQEFACPPEAEVTANSFQEEMAGNLSLTCVATGDPEPEVSWQFNGGPMNITRGEQAFLVEEETRGGFRKWNNVTLYNASETEAGEYVCLASNVAGVAQDSVTIVIPRVYTAPTLSQTDTWLLWVSLAGGGAAALCASLLAVLIAVCLCGSRQKSKRKKVKLQGSASFGDQEKKLLDLSLTNTNERVSGRASFEACSSPGDLELAERSSSLCDPPSNVTVERHCRDLQSQLLPTVFPPPPEFTTSILPAGVFGNIFISVSLAQDGERRYPDLLDIPVHASISDKSSDHRTGGASIPTTSILSGFATLPRRPLRVSDLSSPYDNMGPRVTATGSSTFSLTDPDLRLSPPPPTLVIQPPMEFVSL